MEMIIPTICEYWAGLWGAERPVDVRLAPTEAGAKTAEHGTIRRHHSWGLLTPTSYLYFQLHIFLIRAPVTFILCRAGKARPRRLVAGIEQPFQRFCVRSQPPVSADGCQDHAFFLLGKCRIIRKRIQYLRGDLLSRLFVGRPVLILGIFTDIVENSRPENPSWLNG